MEGLGPNRLPATSSNHVWCHIQTDPGISYKSDFNQLIGTLSASIGSFFLSEVALA